MVITKQDLRSNGSLAHYAFVFLPSLTKLYVRSKGFAHIGSLKKTDLDEVGSGRSCADGIEKRNIRYSILDPYDIHLTGSNPKEGYNTRKLDRLFSLE